MELARNKEGREENARFCVAVAVPSCAAKPRGDNGRSWGGGSLLSCVRTNRGAEDVRKPLSSA